ncbi:hypothetical protein MNBD_UNCLBAC01-1878, partial [hydrothermal vent metagenome]
MKYFIYSVKDDAGRTLKGIIQASTKREVQQRLSKTEYFFMSASEYNINKLYKSKIKLKALILFTNRLTSLIESAVPILQAMNILWRQTEDHTIQLVISYMMSELEEGHSISASMQSFPGIFPPIYQVLIKVGETSGSLPTILRKLRNYLEYKASVISKTQKATFYPSIVIGFAVLVIIGMFLCVVPTFEKVLTQLDIELPFLTQMIINCSKAMRSPVCLIISAMVLGGGILLYRLCRNNKKFVYRFDHLKLKLPYFGHILLIFSLSQFIRSLSILFGAGITIINGIKVSSATVFNKKILADIDEIRTDIEHGESVYKSFRKVNYFPVMLTEMIGVGETS